MGKCKLQHISGGNSGIPCFSADRAKKPYGIKLSILQPRGDK